MKQTNASTRKACAWDALTALSGLLGVGIAVTMGDGFMGAASSLLYFTMQSGLLSGLTAAVSAMRRRRGALPCWLMTLRHVASTASALTFCVFWLTLAPQFGLAYVLSLSNLFNHLLTPVFSVAGYLRFDRDRPAARHSGLWGLCAPLAYLVFSFVVAHRAKKPAFDGHRYPYFFLDHERNGWFRVGKKRVGTAWWIAILCGVTLLLSRWLLRLRRKRVKRA